MIPFPLYPTLQKQVYDPMLFLHWELKWQSFKDEHSSTSACKKNILFLIKQLSLLDSVLFNLNKFGNDLIQVIETSPK